MSVFQARFLNLAFVLYTATLDKGQSVRVI